MDSEMKHLLETILVAEVVNVAAIIRLEKAAKGASSTSGYNPEAVRLIKEKRREILLALQNA